MRLVVGRKDHEWFADYIDAYGHQVLLCRIPFSALSTSLIFWSIELVMILTSLDVEFLRTSKQSSAHSPLKRIPVGGTSEGAVEQGSGNPVPIMNDEARLLLLPMRSVNQHEE